MRTWTIGLLLVVAAHASAQSDVQKDPYREPEELEWRGRDQEAFLKYVQIPGGEHAAVKLARPKAKEYLELLRAKGRAVPLARFKLIEGELLLALGNRADALACYRAAAAKTGTTAKQTWDQGFLPWDHYFVEVPPLSPRDDYYAYATVIHRAQHPFVLGPGSHRDNWLLRRFLAFEAWDEAAREFARIWDFHLRYSENYVTTRWEEDPAKPRNWTIKRDYVVQESGFSNLALLFALDYAFFWKQRKDNDKALEILREAVVRLHMDDDYQDAWDLVPLDPKDPRDLPREHYSRHRFGYGDGGPAGMTAREFMRLAYGEFKSAGQTARLTERLQREIKLGKNRLRPVLARICLHEGKPDEALALELSYLNNRPRLEDFIRAQRRGKTYEDFQRPAQAAAEYEKVLALLPVRPKVEEQQYLVDRTRDDAVKRLLALYAALGQTQKVLDLSLKQFDLGQPLSVPALELAAQVFAKTGQAERFAAWLKKRRAETKNASELASVCWQLHDYPAAMAAAADVAAQDPRWSWREHGEWEARFLKLKMQLAFLKAVSAATPRDLELRLRVLTLENRTKGPEAIKVMEGMIYAAAQDKYNRRPTPTFLYPLLRLYEQNGDTDKLVRLGRHILSDRRPFVDFGYRAYGRRDSMLSGYKEQEALVDSLLVILPYLKDEEDLQAFDKVAQHWAEWDELGNQLARHRMGLKARRIDPYAGHMRDYAKVSVRTVGLPNGVRLLTTRDDVRAISADGQWVGTSWGLVRYREPAKDTLEILQVPLGARVNDILQTPAGLFVGTVTGLFRLDEPDSDNPRAVGIMSLDYAPWLTWYSDKLWIEIAHHILQYDPKKQEVRDHQDVDVWRGGEWQRALITAAGRLWSREAVFDEKTGEFQRLRSEGKIHVLGGTGNEVWASVSVGRLGSRPALIDPRTLAVRVLPIANSKPRESYRCDALLGADRDHVWFGPYPLLAYQRKTGEVHLIRQPHEDEKQEHQGPAFWTYEYRVQRTYVTSGTSEPVPGLNLYWPTTWRELAEHNLVGSRREINTDAGGLFAIDRNTLRWTKLGHGAAELGHHRVHKILFADDTYKAYVCTDGGVAVLSLPDGIVAGRITVSDGLPSNRVIDVVRVGDRLCFACAPFRSEGGLCVLDTKTGMIKRYSMADGLPSYHIKQLRAEGDKVHVLYDTFHPQTSWIHHHNSHREGAIAVGEKITFKSSIFDLARGTITPGGEITKPEPEHRLDVQHQGKRYLAGDIGLLIFDDPAVKLDLAAPALAIKKVLTRSQRWQAEAKERNVNVKSPEDLAKLLAEENPYLREKAMNQGSPRAPREGGPPLAEKENYVAVLQKASQDEHGPVSRLAAAYLKDMATPKTPAFADILRPLLKHADSSVRANAAVGLLRSGHLSDLRHFEEILTAEHPPVPVKEVYEALALQPSPEVLGLLLKYPVLRYPYPDEDVAPPYLQALGSKVRQSQELADLLLQAYDVEPDESEQAPWRDRMSSPVAFAAAVFGAAGKPMLPALYEALKSPERVRRANAARACGAIGEPAAVPHLLKAFDLESGLARAAIVDALGQLKAKDALPELIKLYVDTVNDDWAWGSPGVYGSGAGFRSTQMGVSQAAMYQYLNDLDALKGAWEDLRSTARRPPADPRRHENLLTADHLLKAIRNIGPENSPAFYRTLAGDKKFELRHEAAIHLAAAAVHDPDKNLQVLRNLAADPHPEVEMAATVSLHLLRQPGTQKAIDTWLASPDEGVLRMILVALQRVEDGERLSFARPRLRAIAGDATLHEWYRGQAETLLRRSGER